MNKLTIATEAPATIHFPNESDALSHSTRNGLLCALVVAACVLSANPAASMPFSDDFSYTKTALDFARTGHFLYNGWATAMLGWMIPWGALFIKICGFSFTLLRLSMLPIAMATIYLFHNILRRFGINSTNAVFGTLTFALSPLFLPLAASYMTDICGLLVILLCVYMCQRAVAARSDRSALLWLCFAMLVNMAGGTVRQIAWLGALVMVPSTSWLLRERRGMIAAGVLLWTASLIGVLVCLHWFSKQPYSVPEHIISGSIHPRMLVHLAAELLRTFLCLLLVVFPVSAAWLSLAHQLNRKARLRIAIAIALLAMLGAVLYEKGVLAGWVMPWLLYVLAAQTSLMPSIFNMTAVTVTMWTRLAISLLVIAPALILGEQMASHRLNKLPGSFNYGTSWEPLVWILIPFSLSYILLLTPRGTFSVIFARYVLGLVPVAIVILLKLYQEKIAATLPIISLVALTVVAIFSIADAHDFFAQSRALVSTIQILQSSGVPRRVIQAGMESDGWAQIEWGGHINDPRIKVPAGAYDPDAFDSKIPLECRFWFTNFTPAIAPKYFLNFPPEPCFAPTKYPAVHYRTWLPPFDQTIYVQQLRSVSN